jgi:hypothetical protein
MMIVSTGYCLKTVDAVFMDEPRKSLVTPMVIHRVWLYAVRQHVTLRADCSARAYTGLSAQSLLAVGVARPHWACSRGALEGDWSPSFVSVMIGAFGASI